MTESTSPSRAIASAVDASSNVAHWRAVFECREALFADLSEGARIGLIAQPGFMPDGRRRAGHEAAVAKCASVPMLAFESAAGRIEVKLERFEGFHQAGLDLLFVADDEARAELACEEVETTLRALKRLLRRGNVMFFVFRTRRELQDAGYEDFLIRWGSRFSGHADDLPQSRRRARTSLRGVRLPLVRPHDQRVLRVRRTGPGRGNGGVCASGGRMALVCGPRRPCQGVSRVRVSSKRGAEGRRCDRYRYIPWPAIVSPIPGRPNRRGEAATRAESSS
jgi:hypothetical protein